MSSAAGCFRYTAPSASVLSGTLQVPSGNRAAKHTGVCVSGRPVARSCPLLCTAERPNTAQAVPVYFRSQDVYTEAAPGTNIVQVAHECGVTIATGCSSGSCGICEVEVYKYDEHNANPSPALVRACIAAIPRGYTRLEIDEVSDPIWGGDGWDT